MSNLYETGTAGNSDELPDQRWKAIRAHIAKGDKAKADDHYIAAGRYLADLKAEHTGTWAEWEARVKEKAGIGKSRASELMQIADGRKNVEEARAEKAEVMRKLRAQPSPPRGGENAPDPEASAEADSEGDIESEPEEVLDLVEEVLDGEPLSDKQAAIFQKVKNRLKRRAREDAKREAAQQKFSDGMKRSFAPLAAKLVAAGLARELWEAIVSRTECGMAMHGSMAFHLGDSLVEAIEEALGDALYERPARGEDNAPAPEVGAQIMKAKMAALDDGLDIPESLRRAPRAAAS